MNNDLRKRWLPLAVLAAALVVWAGLLALGAFLDLGANAPPRRLAKPVAILGAMCVFLALWGLALWRRSQNKE
jgi:hypothetical protein